MAKPIGRPNCKIRFTQYKSIFSHAAKTWVLRYALPLKIYMAKTKSIIHCKMAVAKPQPALPSSGIGPQPYIKIKFSGINTSSAARLMAVTGLG